MIMARARNIKPSFFSNDDLADIDPLGRLLFIGLWTIADREGRLEDRPRRIKAEVLPYDDCNVDELLQSLHDHGFVMRYESNGVKCIQVVNFNKHQDPHYKEKTSILPAPEGDADSGKTAGGVSEAVRQRVFDRDGQACKACGATEDLSIDHIIPRSAGGSHDEDNLQTLCRRCNSSKNNRQAKAELDQSLANDRAMIGSSIQGQSPLIPDSPFPITDSGYQKGVRGTPSSPAAQSKRLSMSPKKGRGAQHLSVSDLVGQGVDEQVAREFLAIRMKKRAPLTELALAGIKREAARVGWTLDQTLRKCIERGWQGFEASWVGAAKPIEGQNRQEALEARNREVAERLARTIQ